MQGGKATLPVITAEPRVALYDEKIRLKLDNFPRNEKISLHGHHIQGGRKLVFASCGHYISDELGHVDVTEQPSTGGTYTGLEPMGLLWSLQSPPGHPRHLRMFSKYVDRPSIIHLKAYLGHLQLEDIYQCENGLEVLADVELERWMRFPSEVDALEVHVGNVRGTLFLPHGDGPFQGVIDLFGSTGGNAEYRAALFASHGFAALALPYLRYKDLPTDLAEVTFDYFEEAVNWFSSHPKVFPYGIGVVGMSRGVQFAYCMSAYLEQVRCVVAITGRPFAANADLYHKGKILQKGSEYDVSLAKRTKGGSYVLKAATSFSDNLIPAWRGNGKHLIFAGEDDHLLPPDNNTPLLNACPKEKKSNFEVVTYRGAGHLLEPPYNALCRSAFNPFYEKILLFGGRMKEHAHAQEDAWKRTLNHLRKHIPTAKVDTL